MPAVITNSPATQSVHAVHIGLFGDAEKLLPPQGLHMRFAVALPLATTN
ncbi:MAG: hypothetical protein ABW252_12765 [Polyangiales bacterium]